MVELLKTQQSIAKTLFKESFLSYYAGSTPKFGGNVLYECPSINYVPSKFFSFMHPVLPSLHGHPFAYAFFYLPILKKN